MQIGAQISTVDLSYILRYLQKRLYSKILIFLIYMAPFVRSKPFKISEEPKLVMW